MHAKRRPLGTGPRPTEEPPTTADARRRTVTDRAVAGPLAPATTADGVQVPPAGRRPLGTGNARAVDRRTTSC
ncbi:hypothetical protein ACWD0J_35840 [Streptomyces sp. NPDC003011]